MRASYARIPALAVVALGSGTACQLIGGIGDIQLGSMDATMDGSSPSKQEAGVHRHDARGDGSSRDAAREAGRACQAAEAGVAIGALGCPCSPSGAQACSGHHSTEMVVCAETSSGLVWEGNGACTAGNRCDTAAGQNQGTCQPIAAPCADAAPGGNVCSTVNACDGGTGTCVATPTSLRCGPDLLTTTALETCIGQACVAGNCTGVCSPLSTQCSGTLVETCGDAGTWRDATACAPDAGASLCCGATCVKVCGSCANTCAGGQCSDAGQCTVLLSSDQAGGAIALDAVNAYWIDLGGSSPSVWKAPLAGGPPVALYSPAAAVSLIAITNDANNVYWSEEAAGGSVVKSVPIGGGSPAMLGSSTAEPESLAVGPTEIYWTDGTNIVAAPLSGGAAATLATGEGVIGIALDHASSTLYWITSTSLVKLAVGVGVGDANAPVTLVSTLSGAESLAVDSGDVFWTTSSGTNTGTVMAYLGATGMVTTLTASQDLPFDQPAIAVNSTTVAWISRGGLMTEPRAGGAVSTVSGNRPSGIAMTEATLVWTNSTSWAASDYGVFKQTPP